MSAPGAGPPPMPPPAYGMPPPMPYPMQERTALPVAGGALLLVAGILGIAHWGWVIAIASTVSAIPIIGGSFASLLAICGGIGIIFSLIALLGGVFAIQRKLWGIGLAGGILGLLSFCFLFVFVPNILALVGLILVAISRKEFA